MRIDERWFDILDAFHVRGDYPQNLRTLAGVLRMTVSGVTKHVSAMVDEGYLFVHTDHEYGRPALYKPTDSGIVIFMAILDDMLGDTSEAREQIDEDS